MSCNDEYIYSSVLHAVAHACNDEYAYSSVLHTVVHACNDEMCTSLSYTIWSMLVTVTEL